MEDDARIARDFWESVARHFPTWAQVRNGKLAASEVREGFIHSHGIALQAIGKAGNALLRGNPSGWKSRLKALAQIDWSLVGRPRPKPRQGVQSHHQCHPHAGRSLIGVTAIPLRATLVAAARHADGFGHRLELDAAELARPPLDGIAYADVLGRSQ